MSETVNHPYTQRVYFLGQAAQFFTLLQLLSGTWECRGFVSRGNVGGKSAACYLVGAANNAMWCAYGLMTDQPPIYRINAAGVFLQACYLACYVAYSSGHLRRTVVKYLAVELAALVAFLWWLATLFAGRATQQESATALAGVAAASLSTLFTVSTGATIRTVFKERSSKSLPFPIISMTFVVTFLWSLYGRFQGDPWVYWPNAVGCVFSGAQVALYFYFRAPEQQSKKGGGGSLSMQELLP